MQIFIDYGHNDNAIIEVNGERLTLNGAIISERFALDLAYKLTAAARAVSEHRAIQGMKTDTR